MRLNVWLNTLRIAALTLGSLLTLIGAGLGLVEGWSLLHSETTQGVILSTPEAHPRFLFATKQSRQYEVTSPIPQPQFHQGQAVEIAYSIGDPMDAHIVTGTPRWLYAMVLSIAGVLITYLGLWLTSRNKA